MRDPKRRRLDYYPGSAAQQALEQAKALRPDLGQQALLDMLVIFGAWAAQVDLRPPPLLGRNRQRWRLFGSGSGAANKGV